jgi:hypothetical protein
MTARSRFGIEHSSGPRQYRRLNRGGDRQANTVLHRIVQTRLRSDSRTQDYYERRIKEGKTRREVVRCLKRYAARECVGLPGRGREGPAETCRSLGLIHRVGEFHCLSLACGSEDRPAGTEWVVGRAQPWMGGQAGGQPSAFFLGCEPPLSFCVRDVSSASSDVRSRREGVGECRKVLKGGVQRQPRRHHIAGNLPAVHVPQRPVLRRRCLRQPVGGVDGGAVVTGARELCTNPGVLAVVAVWGGWRGSVGRIV